MPMTFEQFKEDLLVALKLRERSIYDLIEKKPFLCNIKEIIHRKNQGFTLTGKPEFIDLDRSSKNVMITGVSGTFKSQAILIPNLLYTDMIDNQSFIVHDASGELAYECAGFLQQQGIETFIVNPLDENSAGYNPIKMMKPGLSSAKQVAQVIVTASLGTGGENNAFWNNRAEMTLACLLAITRSLPESYQHMQTVTYLLSQLSVNPRGMDAFVAQHVKDRKIFEMYKTNCVAVEPKLYGNILSTVAASVSVMQDETVAKMLSRNDIDISSIRSKRTAIFLVSSPMRAQYTSPVFSLMLHQWCEYLLSYIPKPTELAVKLLLDEFPVLTIPGFSLFIANSRKHSVSTLISVQSIQAILAKLGIENGKSAIANFSTHVYFTNSPQESAEVISKSCGTAEFETENGTVTKALFKPEEIRLLPKDRILILTSGHRPILTHILPAFKNRRFKKRLRLPLQSSTRKAELDDIGLLPTIPFIKPSK